MASQTTLYGSIYFRQTMVPTLMDLDLVVGNPQIAESRCKRWIGLGNNYNYSHPAIGMCVLCIVDAASLTFLYLD